MITSTLLGLVGGFDLQSILTALAGIATLVFGILFKLRGNTNRRQKRTIRVYEAKAETKEQIIEANKWGKAKMKEVKSAEKAELLDMLNSSAK